MKSLRRRLLALGFAVNDGFMIYIAFKAAYGLRFECPAFLRFFPADKGTPDWGLYQDGLRAVIPVWLLLFALWGRQYTGRFLEASEEFMAVCKGVVLGTLLIVAGTFLYREYEYSRLAMAIGFFASIALLFTSRETLKFLLMRLHERLIPQETVIVIGEGKSVEAVLDRLKRQPHTRTLVFGKNDLPGLKKKISTERHLREIFVHSRLLSEEGMEDLLADCEEEGLEIKVLPGLLEMRMGEVTVDDSLRLPILRLKPLSLHGFRYFVKRSFDLTVSLAILAVLLVPFLILSLLIVLDSRGGVFFAQERVGFKEKRFKCFKFRTMHKNAESLLGEMKLESFRGGPAFKMKGDPRVTRVGKWIRKFSFDEFGQLWNVLKGEMSLIGPRPQVLAEAKGNPDWARKRYRVLPGITGLWQVSGRADLSYEDMMRLDIYYLENWSPGMDLKILLKTLPVVLAGKGAY
ncbi:MAG: hypothetical protein A3A86_02120 [Elusimicrobia bacterium RIFCSPLOWO2_01_FULL_60_11]|nr:MAG: hypothetical protein A3A86_02120 [Elusimicrobia bacterium RIFCSPLOWO2_01_FULL_60_11]